MTRDIFLLKNKVWGKVSWSVEFVCIIPCAECLRDCNKCRIVDGVEEVYSAPLGEKAMWMPPAYSFRQLEMFLSLSSWEAHTYLLSAPLELFSVFRVTSRWPCWCTEQWRQKAFGNLILLLCKISATLCHCFVHQDGRLIT